jgi:uncharacterized protein
MKVRFWPGGDFDLHDHRRLSQVRLIATWRYCIYNNKVRMTFDPAKRARTLAERGLDFADAALVFAGVTLEIEDTRKDYGEKRIICFGHLAGRIVVVGYTPRGATVRHVFSMRKANEREQARVAPLLEV